MNIRKLRLKRGDIYIGNECWIEAISVDGRQTDAVNIDYLLDDLGNFWDALEQDCVAECCGLDAFDFTQKTIEQVALDGDLKELRTSIDKLIESVRHLKAEVLVTGRLNQYVDKKTFLELLAHILASIPHYG